jgi:type I restriction enzyme S subunit
VSWPHATLGELCRPKQWPILSKADMTDAGFPVYGANGQIGFSKTYTHETPTLLIGCRGSCGTVHVSVPKAYANGNAMALDALDTGRVDLRFLRAFLEKRGFSDVISGSSQPQITGQNIVRIEIPLPPLDEQRRIAAILDQADDLRRKRREALSQLGTLELSVLAKALDGDGSNAWPTLHVGELCTVKGGKRLPKGDDYSPVPTPYRYIRVSDIEDGEVNQSGLRFLKPSTQRQIGRYTVAEGDIIISIAGTIGAIAEVPASLAGANLTENAAKLCPIESGKYVPAFLAQLLRQAAVQKQIVAKTGQVTIGKLALFRIEQIEVSVPPIPVQRLVVDRIKGLRGQRSLNALHLSHLDTLFASLQHRAFNGEL